MSRRSAAEEQDPRDERRYAPPYAAKLASIHANTVRAWMPDLSGAPEPVLASFLDVIELRIMRLLREKYGFNPARLRRMHAEARRRSEVPHPFASQRILIDARKLWLTGETPPVDLDTDGQTGFPEIVEKVGKEIDWDAAGLARRWRPALGVLVDPSIRWGQPVVDGTRIPTAALYAAALSEGAERVAELYQLSVNQVQHAVEFEARLAA